MDAEKIKKKLNGAILKGTKVRVEKARPEKKKAGTGEEDAAEAKESKKNKKLSKKRKRDDTIPGAEILDRSVKRGWTTPTATAYSSKDKEKDKRINKSKFTTGPECLFKTVIPANVTTSSKATTTDTDKVERKRHRPGKEAVVHEFAKTTKYATFLRSTASGNKKITAEFVEGKGWVDEDGNVVEEVTIKMVKTSESKPIEPKPTPVTEKNSESDSSKEDSSDSGSSSEEDEEGDEEKLIDEPTLQTPNPVAPTSAPPAVEDFETSSSGSSSEESESDSKGSSDSSEADSDEEIESSSESENETVDSRPTSRPQSSSGGPLNLSIKIPIPEITTTPVSAEVHPLEALYKRPKLGNTDLAPKPAASSFSFFGADADNDEEMEEAQDKVPLTPFTQRDFEYRGLRSAAPTPDTAHANKKFLWPKASEEDEEDDDDHAPSSPIRQKKGENSKTLKPKEGKVKEVKAKEGAAPESDFQKWFYENRGGYESGVEEAEEGCWEGEET